MNQRTGQVPLKVWLLAIRPRTLPASVAPILVATALALAEQAFAWPVFVAALVCALSLQVAVNLANDYFDHRHGHDTAQRLGPIRVSQQGLINARAMRRGITWVLLCALLSGLYLVSVGGIPILLLGAASLLGVWCYSGGPFPLASHGLGEVAVFIFFGLVAVAGCFFLYTGNVNSTVFGLAAGVGLLNAAIMVINNLRDRHTDAKTGKRTLAVRWGRQRTVLFYQGLLAGAFGLLLLLWAVGAVPLPVLLLPLLCAPDAVRLGRRIALLDGAVLNLYLGQTAQLTLWFSLLLALGVVLA